ncbi:hypothetical protein O1611_g6385 [Lasiodiplodia mahajangana]|uniref:Uncharacterized protein n=1 Tax=Lasiodiplodia mahajangana TaxID=1108764 RepID=A0ACC2JIE4_9PEZI|nr:hypothetical protein O1611_g6385 [Lasiodiplodia mahajangana]
MTEQTHYEIPLFDLGIDGAGFRVENDGDELQRAAIDQYKGSDIKYVADLIAVVHGTMTPTVGQQGEAEGLANKPGGGTSEPSPNGPIVKQLAPAGTFGMDEAAQTREEKIELHGSLEGGWNPITLGLGGSFERTSTTDTKTHAILKGVSWIEGRNRGAKNAATWDLQENRTLASGVPPHLRAAILLELPEEGRFRAEFHMTADVGAFHKKVKRRVGAKIGLDPVYFDPSETKKRDLGPPPEAVIKTNLSGCNLDSIGYAKVASFHLALALCLVIIAGFWFCVFFGHSISPLKMAQGCDQDNRLLSLIQKPSHDTKRPCVDIIALHGLQSTFAKTWRDNQKGGALSPWLRDYPFTARIFAYNGSMSFSSDQGLLDKSALEARAVALLAEISNKGEKKATGILVKELLWIANRDSRYLDIALATRAMIFYNIPNTSSSLEDDLFKLVLATIDTGDSDSLRTQQNELTELISQGTSAVRAATLRFEMIQNQYRIVSLHEVAPAEGGGVVLGPLNKDDPNLNILVPAARGKLPLSQPVSSAVRVIQKAIEEPRKDYQYVALACRQKVSSLHNYDDNLGKLHTGVALPVVSPLCADLVGRLSGLTTIYGSAGSGKSVLAEQISTSTFCADSVVVLSFSFSAANSRRGSYRDLLLSFILQLLYQGDSMFDSAYVGEVYSRTTWDSNVSSADLYRLLDALLSTQPKATIVSIIDTVNECNAESLIQLVGDFKRIVLKRTANYRVFLIGRPSDNVVRILGPFTDQSSVNLDEHMKQVTSQLMTRDLGDEKFKDLRNHLEEENATPSKTSFMAALARMDGLSNIPDRYDSTYKQLLGEIGAPQKWLEEVLLYMAFAKRPPTAAELADAIGVGSYSQKLDDLRPTLRKILSASPKQLKDDLEFAMGSLFRAANNIAELAHDTLHGVVRPDLDVFARNEAGISASDYKTGARSLCSLWGSPAVLSSPEIDDAENTAIRHRPVDYPCFAPISSQYYSFARYGDPSFAHSIEVHNGDDSLEEASKATRAAFSPSWDDVAARSWWSQTFSTLDGESTVEAKTELERFFSSEASAGNSVIKLLRPGENGSFAASDVALSVAVRRGSAEMTQLLTTALGIEEDLWLSAALRSCTYGRADILISILLLWRAEATGQELPEDELRTCLGRIVGYGHWHIIHALRRACPRTIGAMENEMLVSLIEDAAAQGRDGVIAELLSVHEPLPGSQNILVKPNGNANLLEMGPNTANALDQMAGSLGTGIESDDTATGIIIQKAEGEAVPKEAIEEKQDVRQDLFLGPAMVKAVEFGSAAVASILASASPAVLEYRVGFWRMDSLHWAAIYNKTEALCALLDSGADIESLDDQDATPLLLACLQGHTNIVRALLERGANPNHAATRGAKHRALHLAARRGSAAIVQMLLEAGASGNSRIDKPHRDTPLHQAMYLAHQNPDQYMEAVQVLLEFGADVDITKGGGKTALHLAIDVGLDERIVRTLLQFGADIDKLDGDGRSPLYCAVYKKEFELVETLWNPRGRKRESVLFNAAAEANMGRLHQLLEAGYEKKERDKWGRTAYDVAKSPEIRSLLAPTPVMPGSMPEDDGRAAVVPPMHRDQWCSTWQDEIIHHYSWWRCDICGRYLEDERFYHCCGCSGNCMVYGTVDMCHGCYTASECSEAAHKVLMRFVGNRMLSIQEFSPNIATFGWEVGDANQGTEMVEPST